MASMALQILCSTSSNRTWHLHRRSIPRLTVSPKRGFVMSRTQCGESSTPVIAATSNPKSGEPQQKRAKIPDFFAGIPFGSLVLSDGLVRFIFSYGNTTLHSNVFFGGALLALSAYSLYIWSHGKSSVPVILGQAVLSWALFGKNLHDYTLVKKFIPSGFFAFNCAAMACFYLYVVASGGNPPQNVKNSK